MSMELSGSRLRLRELSERRFASGRPVMPGYVLVLTYSSYEHERYTGAMRPTSSGPVRLRQRSIHGSVQMQLGYLRQAEQELLSEGALERLT